MKHSRASFHEADARQIRLTPTRARREENIGRLLGLIGGVIFAAAVLRRLAGWPFRVAAARRAMRDLAGMSARELADIGLSRQDLRDASALPLDDDPTRILVMRVAERARR
jgi:uncharacterized protein YjiS (DUF1127 family)